MGSTSRRSGSSSLENELNELENELNELHGAMLLGHKLGAKMAVSMMRSGSLRLSPLPFERNEYPYDAKLRPLRATLLIWRAWFRETFNDHSTTDEAPDGR